MRRFAYTLIVLCGLFLGVSAQKRLVLVEEFTNTGCSPCASWSPVLDSCIRYRLGDCIAIKYHSGYPNKADEFYTYDPEPQQTRLDFYGVSGVPSTFINGQELPERSFAYLDAAISYCQQQPALFDLALTKQLDGQRLSVSATVAKIHDADSVNYLQPAEDLSAYRLFLAVIEEHIGASTPWPNGERELSYTLRKMLTPGTGIALNTTMEQIGAEWDIDVFGNLDQLGVVAFVQDMESHDVVATAYSGPNAEGENRVALVNLFGTPDLICQPEYHGQVVLRNDGANTITRATLNVKVNGSVEKYRWTGNLHYLDRDTMTFEGFTNFQLVSEGRNQAEVWLSDINGTGVTSNSLTTQFDNSVQATYGVRLKLYTDKKPEETSWTLFDGAGNVVRQGGPYTEARKFITVDFDLRRDDCYQLEFLDAGGDGIKGSAGNGYYQLFQMNEDGKQGPRLTQGDYAGAVWLVNFRLVGAPAPKRQRLVLFEEFTNTSCDPCAEFSPSLDRVIFERMGEIVPITYHWNFPSNRDPFYLTNPDDVLARADFYGISGVPALFVDGEHAGAWGYESYLGDYIDYGLSQEPLIDLAVTAELSADDLLTVKAQVSNLKYAATNELRLFSAVVEERVEWAEAADNGERSWNYVMRKLLPSAEGQLLDASQVTPAAFEYSWPVSGFYRDTELGIVTFVQDMGTKKILEAAYTPRPTGSPRAAKLVQVLNTPDRICSPLFSADLMVRNTGSETLTSATVCVSVNGQVQRTPWTGTLEPLALTTIRTPDFTDFQLTDDKTNAVELWLADLNGDAQDESIHYPLTVSNAYKATNAVRLTIMTDQKPEETTWTLLNAAGDVVCQGGPYAEPRKRVVIDLPLNADDCYLLEFEDGGGDGITGSNGRGYYMLHEVASDGKTRLLVQDTYTDALHDVYFSLQNAATTAIPQMVMPSQQPDRSYDLQGRPASRSSHIIIYKDRKVITNK